MSEYRGCRVGCGEEKEEEEEDRRERIDFFFWGGGAWRDSILIENPRIYSHTKLSHISRMKRSPSAWQGSSL